jgi:pyruvate dehydrogenase E2 component (dihydrolipoamide acetyltransferase)
MTEGKLLLWRKKPGDRVARGDIIAEVETDKADIEVEVFTSGVVEKLLVEPGTKVPVGTPLAIIRPEGEVEATPGKPLIPAPIPIEVVAKESAIPVAQAPVPTPPSPLVQVRAEAPRLHISPVARKLAAELGIDPHRVVPSGPGGRITREDIEHAAKAQAIAAPPPPRLPVAVAPTAVAVQVALAPTAPPEADSASDKHARMRQAIAAAMARSNREIPHYYLSTTIDLKRALDWLMQENLKRPVEDRLLYGVLLVKAVALALREVPELNAVWEAGKLVVKPDIHVGVAISLRGGGLIAPALHDTDKKTLNELMSDFRDLIQRTRSLSLRSSELSDSTITVTSLGEQGVEGVFGIIYPPQVALVGFGKIQHRPWVVDGDALAVRPLITATLSGDHRVSDGHRGGIFLNAVERWLQQPEKL